MVAFGVVSAPEPDELKRWRSARQALAEGVAFLDREGRILDCDEHFAELLGRMLSTRAFEGQRAEPAKRSGAGAERLLGQPLAAELPGPEFAQVRPLLGAQLRARELHRLLVPSRGFALRIMGHEGQGGGCVVVLHELKTPTVDEDVGFLREQLGIRDEMIAAQQRLISELMAPSIPISPTLVVVPFVGPFHYDRVEEVLDRLLEGIRGTQTLVVDLTGVTDFDASAAAGLGRLHGVLALLGVEMVVTGISVELAMALTEDGGELPELEIHASLQAAIAAHA